MNKIFIISNRLPLRISIEKNKVVSRPSVGGLATGLKSVHQQSDSLWVGWSGLREEEIEAKHRDTINSVLEEARCISVPLTSLDVDAFYFGFCNKTIWPLFHYFTEYTEFENHFWQAYDYVNHKFADVVAKYIESGDVLWIHDYQLLLLPKYIRELHDDLSIGFFLHIPFPSFEVFRTLPWRNELLDGMLGADLVGFHTYNYERHFLSSIRRLLGHDIQFNEINLGNRIVKADSFPMGIDYERFNKAAIDRKQHKSKEKSTLQKEIEQYISILPGLKLVLSIDRLDYTKGIANRLYAFEYFLDRFPEFHGKVTLVMLTVPSRSNVKQYQKMKSEVDEQVGRINGKYSTVTWTPVWYFYRSMPFGNLIDLYISSKIALILPIRDGMNLVAKEYIASQVDGRGVLILSEMAGAAQEMSEAIIVNPNNYEEIAHALKEAILMNEKEQVERNTVLQLRLKRYDVEKWANDFIQALKESRKRQSRYYSNKLTDSIQKDILLRYEKSKCRVLFLDYDGTLVGFQSKPELARPDTDLIKLLNKLSKDKRNKIVIITGRIRETIDEWFNACHCTFVVEHGVWYREYKTEWQLIEPMNTEWKELIRPVIEVFIDRTPGSLLEEKNYSLVWHYRKCDPELGTLRANELKDELTSLIANRNLEIMEGHKVLEVKNAGINKGRVASRLLMDNSFDFILGVGDDWTDEYLFRELPENAITIKVGFKNTLAQYNVSNYLEVRAMLEKLTE
jgi:trehalose 6-phosphate synthase/phosphatase